MHVRSDPNMGLIMSAPMTVHSLTEQQCTDPVQAGKLTELNVEVSATTKTRLTIG